MSSYGQHSFTLILHVQSAQNLATQANAAFCTTFVWSNSSPNGPAESRSKPKYTSFSHVRENKRVAWNEDVQIDVSNPKSDVLTVRVKDSSDALVGSCNIYLAHLRPGETLDQWFQLHPAGHIHLKLTLKPNQQATPTRVNASPYSSDFQAMLDLQLKKRAAAVNESPLPSNIAMLVEMQNQANENLRLQMNQHLMQQQQATRTFMQAPSQSPYPAGYPQSSGTNFHEMMGTAANISTIAANMQQLNGNTGGNNGLDHYAKGMASKYNQPPPTYSRPQQRNGASSPGFIETIPPQPQQKRSMGEMISTAADVASILSDVASVATSVQQLAGGGDTGGGGGIPFAMPDMSQFAGGQDLSGMLAGQDLSAFVGQDFSGLTGDTTAQYF
ncbi:hypothetical protein PHPALM_28259 [Phytophthora palmivora]|uniref:C2 domain-containing protein n=2 Tax=Phytophthora palmivora TaxID=4796 RepID=A0A2P4XAL3_9STRA|nr:hypothetical protein PHPALM_28259 [Phytophthora palmivora]